MNDLICKHLSAGIFAGSAYRDTGIGFPVVLLHGFPEDGKVWEQQMDLLREDYRLIVPDLPGSGGSPSPAGLLTIDSLADFVYAILLAERLKACIVVGHSMGGYIALAFAENYPELLKGFGLFNSSALPDTEEKKQSRLKSVEIMKKYGAAAFVKQAVPGLFGKKFREANGPVVEALIMRSASLNVNALIAYYQAMIQRPDRRSILQQTKVPVLFVIGKADTTIPLAAILQQVSLPAASAIHILEEVGHMAMLEAPADTGRQLHDFIDLCLNATYTKNPA